MLHTFFCNSLHPRSFKEKSDQVMEIHYYKNDNLLFSTFYENSKLVKKFDFESKERSKSVLKYYQNYHFKTVYAESGEISSMHISINNIFNDNGRANYQIKSENDWKIQILENGIQEIRLDYEGVNINYCFQNENLIKLIFEIAEYEDSYIINANYDNLGRIIKKVKEFPKHGFSEVTLFDYEDDLVIEKSDENSFQIKRYDHKNRPLVIVDFNNHEDKLDLIKKYVRNSNEENLIPIMKLIRLETFKYDQFDNQTAHDIKYYRPDFSKERLTSYIEDYVYYDRYNINYGHYYCKTKDDYDDDSESLSTLEYFENKVYQYKDEDLEAIHHIKNEKKIKSEYFSKEYNFEKLKEDRNGEISMSDVYVLEKYDEFGNAVESFVHNKITGKIDNYKVEIIFKD